MPTRNGSTRPRRKRGQPGTPVPTEATTQRTPMQNYAEALEGYRALQDDIGFFMNRVQDLAKPSDQFKAATLAAAWLSLKYAPTWGKRPAYDEHSIITGLTAAVSSGQWADFVSTVTDWDHLYATREVLVTAGPQLFQQDRAIRIALAHTAAAAAARALLRRHAPAVTNREIAELAARIILLMAQQHEDKGSLPSHYTRADVEAAAAYEQYFRLHTPVLLCLGTFTTKEDVKAAIDRDWETKIHPHLSTVPPAAHRPIEYHKHVTLHELYLAYWAIRRRPADDAMAKKAFIAAVPHDVDLWAGVWNTEPSSYQVGKMLEGALDWLPCLNMGTRDALWARAPEGLSQVDLASAGGLSSEYWRLIDEEAQPKENK